MEKRIVLLLFTLLVPMLTFPGGSSSNGGTPSGEDDATATLLGRIKICQARGIKHPYGITALDVLHKSPDGCLLTPESKMGPDAIDSTQLYPDLPIGQASSDILLVTLAPQGFIALEKKVQNLELQLADRGLSAEQRQQLTQQRGTALQQLTKLHKRKRAVIVYASKRHPGTINWGIFDSSKVDEHIFEDLERLQNQVNADSTKRDVCSPTCQHVALTLCFNEYGKFVDEDSNMSDHEVRSRLASGEGSFSDEEEV